MGYETYCTGSLRITPPLSEEDFRLLKLVISYDEPSEPLPPELQAIRDRAEDLSLLEGTDCDEPPTVDELHICANDYNGHFQQSLPILLDEFFSRRGYSVEGEFEWSGDSTGDLGTCYVKGDRVEWVQDVISNPGPSWNRKGIEKI
jgi:hypothetical protein